MTDPTESGVVDGGSELTRRKRQVRDDKLRKRRELGAAARDAADRAVAKRICQSDVFEEAEHVAAYASTPCEVSTVSILETALQQQKKLYLPRVVSGEKILRFYRIRDLDDLQPAAFGIPAPPTRPALRLDCLDALQLVLVPLVAFDEECHRLGRGGGYYDATLPRCVSARQVGLAYELQKSPTVPSDDLDWSIDAVITERRAYHCPRLRS